MSTGVPRAVSAKRMEQIFHRGDVAYTTECLIITRKDSEGREQYHPQIRELLDQYELVFGPIPPGRPPDRGFEHMIELEVGTTVVSPRPSPVVNHVLKGIVIMIRRLVSQVFIS